MPIRHYDISEWYPVFLIEDEPAHAYEHISGEFTDEELVRIAKAFNEFEEIQTMIAQRFGKDPPHHL